MKCIFCGKLLANPPCSGWRTAKHCRNLEGWIVKRAKKIQTADTMMIDPEVIRILFTPTLTSKGARQMMKKIGRLAMRHEGDQWNAYYALENTMDGAVFLGSIAMTAVAENPERRQAFMDMMRDVVSDILEERVGTRPEWDEPQIAPEHERSGHS